jgi:hypothetical protein
MNRLVINCASVDWTEHILSGEAIRLAEGAPGFFWCLALGWITTSDHDYVGVGKARSRLIRMASLLPLTMCCTFRENL